MIGLSGEWKVCLYKGNADNGNECAGGSQKEAKREVKANIMLPGTINGSGLGERIGENTEWNSGLFNPFWYEREEYGRFISGKRIDAGIQSAAVDEDADRGGEPDCGEDAGKTEDIYKVPFL